MTTDPILEAIDNAVRDHGTSADAMRWTPEPPQAPAPSPMPPTARVEGIEIRVKTSDGVEHTYTMSGAHGATISLDWEDPFRDQWVPYAPTTPTRMESFTLTVDYPQELRETRRTL